MHKLGVVQGFIQAHTLLPETAFRSEDSCGQHQRARGHACIGSQDCHVRT